MKKVRFFGIMVFHSMKQRLFFMMKMPLNSMTKIIL